MNKQFSTITRSLLVIAGLAILPGTSFAQQKEVSLRSILLEQFRNSWNQQDWYVPVSRAVDGLSAQQAMWKPADSSHSVGELAYHIYFWNKEQLDKFEGRKPASVENNNETFSAFTEASWTETVKKLNQVMSDWEKAIVNADDAKLKQWASAIDHINTHTAYHTGQILYIRKLAGHWDSNNGVK